MTPRTDRPKRRTFTAEYKASVLAEYDAALEATMCPTICSFHTSGVVIAEGSVA